ncbi:MAG TPA: hypothetical protein VLU73_18445, partial [Methylococcaceae bacterium]|nr:hypothetical protein [Methylococcaceae bacterium]
MMFRRLPAFWLLVALAVTGPSRIAAKEIDVGPRAAVAEAEIATAPVEIDGSVLFRVRGVSAYPAEKRAGAIKD